MRVPAQGIVMETTHRSIRSSLGLSPGNARVGRRGVRGWVHLSVLLCAQAEVNMMHLLPDLQAWYRLPLDERSIVPGIESNPSHATQFTLKCVRSSEQIPHSFISLLFRCVLCVPLHPHPETGPIRRNKIHFVVTLFSDVSSKPYSVHPPQTFDSALGRGGVTLDNHTPVIPLSSFPNLPNPPNPFAFI